MTDSVHDLRRDAPQYVAEALKAVAPRALTVAELADAYRLPRPNNMADVKAELSDEVGNRPDTHEVKVDLITEAIDEINNYNDANTDEDGQGMDPIVYDEAEGAYRLAENADADTLQLNGEPLIRRRGLPDLFNPETGAWRNNIRSYTSEGLKELRELMTEFGWDPRLPAIKDENGVVIMGHRRLDVAAELGIEPVIKTEHFGEGEAADKERARLALTSNMGAQKMSQADRKKIASDLYGQGWRMDKIAKLLKVATMTISRDLKGLTNVKHPERGGRRPKEGTTVPQDIAEAPASEQAAADEAVILDQPEAAPEPEAATTETSPQQETSAAMSASDQRSALVQELATLVEETKKVIARLAKQTVTREQANLIRGELSPALRGLSVTLLAEVKVEP